MKFWRPGITGKLFSGDFRHLHCLADQYALGGAYQF